MTVVDSCGWLEYFPNGANADFFAPSVEDPASLIVPAISLFEVFKRVVQQTSENDTLQAVAVMQQAQVVVLDETLALAAAKLSFNLKLPMADSLILATAHAHAATLWTQDDDFEGIPVCATLVKFVGSANQMLEG